MPSLLRIPWISRGWSPAVGCSPWGHEELDRTERLPFHFHFSLSCIGEGNGNPLQCSCLENPRDRGAWWAAVSEVAQSQTRLKRLSSSGSNLAAHRPVLSGSCPKYLLCQSFASFVWSAFLSKRPSLSTNCSLGKKWSRPTEAREKSKVLRIPELSHRKYCPC